MEKKKLLAIITGAAQGIGKSIAIEFIINNYNVAVADINEHVEDKWWEKEEYKFYVIFIKTDVSNEESVINMVSKSREAFGDDINVLVNNAAISNPYQYGKSLEELSYEEWNRYISVNLSSVFLCSKHVIPYMKEGRNGSIINIASTRALMSEPRCEAYAAAKGGVVSMTHSLAVSYGKYGIRANCVVPGWINSSDYEPSISDHEQHVVGRVGKVEDVSEIVLFLADSKKSGFVTGQSFVIDGGMTVKMIYRD